MDSGSQDCVWEWHPANLLRDGPPRAPYAVIILNQPLRNTPIVKRIWAQASFRVAADGGANRLFDFREPAGEAFDNLDAVVGDLDSLRDETRAYFAAHGSAIVHNPDQYSTDFCKAVDYIWDKHPEMNLVALGGLGGRVDQGVSQLHHLYLYQKDTRGGHEGPDRRIFLLSNESLTFLLHPGQHHIHVREDACPDVFAKYIGILPLQGPSIITTHGFEWDVTKWDTQFGGHISTSNHVLPDVKVAQVETNRSVVFTIALKET